MIGYQSQVNHLGHMGRRGSCSHGPMVVVVSGGCSNTCRLLLLLLLTSERVASCIDRSTGDSSVCL